MTGVLIRIDNRRTECHVTMEPDIGVKVVYQPLPRIAG